MANQHLITAEFFGNPVSIIDHAGKRWLTAEEAGRCLGYNEANASQGVRNLYNRHIDEFTEADTCQIKLIWQGQMREIRVFSGTGCRLLGFFANTPQAKKFRAWAAQTLETIAPITEAPLPAVTNSPRLDASLARLSQSQENLAVNMAQMTETVGVLATGMNTVLTQLDVTKKYIGLLEINQVGKIKVTPEVVEQAKVLKAEGMNNSDIARVLRVSRTAISLIVRDKYQMAKGNAPEVKPVGEILEGWIEREKEKLTTALNDVNGGV